LRAITFLCRNPNAIAQAIPEDERLCGRNRHTVANASIGQILPLEKDSIVV
jgi:hypothetical protein